MDLGKLQRQDARACVAEMLVRRNLMIWNTAIYCTLVARDTVMVSPRCTLV
jgi:hypothetical protein